MFLHRLGKVHAPEFPLGLTWINSAPLSLRELRGKVVLVDFWTYSCVNCVRTMPHLREWHEAYSDKGLVIIGVHTPEFEFEKDQKNVEKAVKNFELKYPVVLDTDYKVWNLFANRWWPRKFLIDAHGTIVYDHVGEGGYAETEQAIQHALGEIGIKNLPEIKPDMSVGGGICYRTTPETYLGYLRGRYGNVSGFEPDKEGSFTDVEVRTEEMVYLHGHWKIEAERIMHTRKLAHANEYIFLRYSAFSVNLVMGAVDGKRASIEVELNGQPLPEDMFGEDVEMRGGKAIVETDGHRMYRIVDADTYHHGNLKIKTTSGNIAFYAFTFGSCKGM